MSQAFRDALSDKYKSSNAYKKMRREVEQTGQLFETYLQNQDAAPEKPQSVEKAENLQPSSLVVDKVQAYKQSTPSFTDSLVGLLEQDLTQHRQKQAVFSQEFSSDLEPRPIAGFNPFARQQMTRQGNGSSFSSIMESQPQPQFQLGRQGPSLSFPGTKQLQSSLSSNSVSFLPRYPSQTTE